MKSYKSRFSWELMLYFMSYRRWKSYKLKPIIPQKMTKTQQLLKRYIQPQATEWDPCCSSHFLFYLPTFWSINWNPVKVNCIVYYNLLILFPSFVFQLTTHFYSSYENGVSIHCVRKDSWHIFKLQKLSLNSNEDGSYRFKRIFS